MPSRRLALALFLLGITGLGITSTVAAPLPKDDVLQEAFEAVAFGTEIPGLFGSGPYLKRFVAPIRFAIEDRAALPRREEAEAFLRRLARQMPSLDARLARPGESANFTIHIVDAKDYQATGRRIHSNPFLRVPGACIVRARFGRAGIRRSDALIVSDRGESLFRRCLAEEVIQGLGLLDDTALLPDSVLNETSRAERPTRADRILIETLHDPRLSPGMTRDAARPLLKEAIGDARRRTR